MTLGGLGTNFHDSGCPGDWLNGLVTFQGGPGVNPRSKAPAWRRLNGWFPGFGNNNSKIPETNSRDPETETLNLETELRVHVIHGTLETGLQMMPGSLVVPTRGAGGLFLDKLLGEH